MREIKRVLWVDDHPEIEVSNLFRDSETKKVRLMGDAVKEISSSHLYDYDTIVFDIDFGNGLPDPDEVIAELTKKIYLEPSQKKNEFIINNGGYLLFIYLLERGYPSQQVAFLTGNPAMLDILKEYSCKKFTLRSKEEIVAEYKKAWDTAKAKDNDWHLFVKSIMSLPVEEEYNSLKAINKCSEYLENEDYDGLKEYISTISPKVATESTVQNTGDKMIYRFHNANLEPPAFFTKKDVFIRGHDKGEAAQWLEKHRTKDKLTRWLILSAGYHVKSLFDKDQVSMKSQIASLFSGASSDPGIWSSFSQLYNLFYGIREFKQKEPYYQAISAMLIPFSNTPKKSKRLATLSGVNYTDVQRAFAWFSKQTRNYCAHNLFGTSVSNETAIFIIWGTLIGILSSNQRACFSNWFANANEQYKSCGTYTITNNIAKIDKLGTALYEHNRIDDKEINAGIIPSQYSSDKPLEMLRALGYNKQMNMINEPSSTVRERYYVFTLAAYVVKWFDGLTEQDVCSRFGKEIELIYRVSNEIVDSYEYPKQI